MTCIRYGHEFGIAAYNLIFTRGTSYGPVFVRCLSVAGDLSKPLDKRISCTVLCRPKETRVSTKITFLWKFILNSRLRKFRQCRSIVAITCYINLARSIDEGWTLDAIC